MAKFKFQLLAATMLALPAMPAYAQVVFPTVELRGVGASAPADVNVKVGNCIGTNQDLATNSTSSFTNIAEADFVPTTPNSGNPTLVCSVDDVNGNIYNGATTFANKYVSTGSGFGRQHWRNFKINFTGAASSQNAFSPFTGTFGVDPVTGAWPNVQYAFSEAPATVADINDYNVSNDGVTIDPSTGLVTTNEVLTVNGVANTNIDTNARAAAGAPIQFPLYVIPVAFAYNPVYGSNNGTPMTFNNTAPQTINGVAAGGIKLKKTTYCAIWNGTITNWNDTTASFGITALNGSLQDTVNDTPARWAAEGVPIRLVCRADTSGTTDIFTRALSTQCSGTKFARAAEGLPYQTGGTINITGLRSSSPYFPTNSSSTVFAGTTQSLNGYVYDRTNNRFCFHNEATAAACSATPAAVTFTQFQTGGSSAGLFLVADGSSSVEAAVRLNTGLNAALTSPSNGLITLNGKFGYIGADFVAGSTGRTLHSAALQQGTGGTYLMPNTKNASTAFGKVLPPQSNTKGQYNTADVRVVYADVTNVGLGTQTVNRTNPLHWINVLYPPSGVSLANPTTGYPVTGSSNFLTYTCFNDEAKRAGVGAYLNHLFGNIKKKAVAGGVPATSTNVSANAFKGVGATAIGILTKSNIALPATAWQKAINATFLQNNALQTGTKLEPGLGGLNLWIQSRQAVKTVEVAPVVSNPSCATDNGGTGGTIVGA